MPDSLRSPSRRRKLPRTGRSSPRNAPIESANPDPVYHTFSRDIIDKLKLHYEVHVSAQTTPKTRWKTDADVPELDTSDVFINEIPTDLQSDPKIQALKTKIDEYHAIDDFHLAERISKIGDIITGADAYTETATEINATWSTDTYVTESRTPLDKRPIDVAMQQYTSVGHVDYDGRIARLKAVSLQIESFSETINLRGGLKASSRTAAIDTALAVCEGVPEDDYEGRLAALAAVQTACNTYVVTVRRKKKLFNPILYSLIAGVEALESRVREKRGEVGVLRGISVMRPILAAKLDELYIMKATDTLKTSARAVKKDLEEKEKSTRLLIEHVDASDRLNAVRDAIKTYFLSMVGIQRLPADLTRDDLLPLVKKVIPEATDVQPVA